MNINKKNNNFGFTLLETIVAVSILVTAIMGPFSLASQSINAQGKAKNNLIAANLAQEALELFRNFRANNILRHPITTGDFYTDTGPYWLDGAGDKGSGTACWSSNGCGIDALTYIQFPPNSSVVDLLNCGASNNYCVLYLNDISGVYGHTNTGSTITKFHRKITIQEVTTDPPEIKVTATVWWDDSLGAGTFSVTTHLMNW